MFNHPNGRNEAKSPLGLLMVFIIELELDPAGGNWERSRSPLPWVHTPLSTVLRSMGIHLLRDHQREVSRASAGN